ncbi:hypothetical protein DPMN_192651 [Dreissena polymorpha]|uniref:Uncharacterized protein n=1 Tax=Dreissena polymorpha TaxID=45954 RepID=A0A9D3Y535_DREPO|nr:hypothetical protein DPMN_192651 [Dreissena polymorpha]
MSIVVRNINSGGFSQLYQSANEEGSRKSHVRTATAIWEGTTHTEPCEDCNGNLGRHYAHRAILACAVTIREMCIAPNVLLTDEEIEYRLKLEYQAYMEAEGNFLRELGITKEEEPLPQTYSVTQFLSDTVPQRHRNLVSRYPCWNRILKTFANRLDPDETPQNVASHQDRNWEENKGHMLLRKMGMYTWDRGGEQGTYAAKGRWDRGGEQGTYAAQEDGYVYMGKCSVNVVA